MPNQRPNLDDYFPAGNKADRIKTRISNEIQQGIIQMDGRVATLNDIQNMKNETNRKATRTSRIHLVIGTIIAIILFLLGRFIL